MGGDERIEAGEKVEGALPRRGSRHGAGSRVFPMLAPQRTAGRTLAERGNAAVGARRLARRGTSGPDRYASGSAPVAVRERPRRRERAVWPLPLAECVILALASWLTDERDDLGLDSAAERPWRSAALPARDRAAERVQRGAARGRTCAWVVGGTVERRRNGRRDARGRTGRASARAVPGNRDGSPREHADDEPGGPGFLRRFIGMAARRATCCACEGRYGRHAAGPGRSEGVALVCSLATNLDPAFPYRAFSARVIRPRRRRSTLRRRRSSWGRAASWSIRCLPVLR